MEVEEEEEEQLHRIWELPDDLLIRILSFLPVEEIARAKLVSKAWKNLSEFSFVPPLTFEQPRHCNGTISSFLDSIDSSLKLHYQKGLSLSRIHLCLDFDLIGSSPSPSQIDSWIDAALERKVGQLDLCFLRYSILNCYPLPAKVFVARTITVLSLEGFRLESRGNIHLPALRKLCLRRSHCDELSVPKLISSCQLIRDLEISRCHPWQKIHVSGFARTITDLHLEECSLEIYEDTNIDLPELRKLSLRKIRCEEQAIQKLISSCPLIQDLETWSCELQGLHVSGLVNLQRLSVVDCYELESIEIDAPRLQYLEFYHYHYQGCSPCDLVFTSSSEFLRELRLYDIQYITDQDFFQSLVIRFPNLELLNIAVCDSQRIEISHHKLKRLELTLSRAEAMLKIDTPNLQSLKYRGYRMPLISAISSLNTSSLHELDIFFLNYNFRSHFSILQSNEFFLKMTHWHCQDMKLHLCIRSKQELIIPGNLRPNLSPPVYDIKHLNLIVHDCPRYQFIIDRMLWMCHPQILSFSYCTTPRFLKVLYNKFRNKEEQPKCCTSCTTKCWRHYLEDVQIDGDESRAEIDRIITATELSSTIMKCEVRFKLQWRS